MVSNKNSNAIDNIEDNTFIQSSEEKDTYLEYMIEKNYKNSISSKKNHVKYFQ